MPPTWVVLLSLIFVRILKHYFGIDRTLSDVVSYNRKHEQNTTRQRGGREREEQ